ncbi:MAG TPA: tRNA (adenosine(37)-N6)-threonylcarbamoyltransferase complex dimerization subunit type 1 TsaB [Acidobacteriaceae bacterium]|jgi:tRNA threonylcarbamoyladenosine biosynthesis protein TsaB|nr:tRNA (adenosine(37)-N6)-threonylcarbamoyltransferase complex dimerization subunit type 1 TsaB [Acidobacteriaceae bacterium]
MNLLAIDTCGALGSVALARLDADLAILGQTEIPGKTYSAQLVPAIRDLLTHHNITLPNLDAIVVTNGPGSFTGIRIGLSTAKGLAEAHSIPLLAVSRLAVLAHKAQAPAGALDASRHEFYLREAAGEGLLALEALRERAAVLGPGLTVCESFVHAIAPDATLVDPPTSIDAISCALPRFQKRDFDDPLTLDGNYLRRSDAEIFSKPALAGAREP